MRWEGPELAERDMSIGPEIVRRGFKPRRMFQWNMERPTGRLRSSSPAGA
jgi:hypothetical protein